MNAPLKWIQEYAKFSTTAQEFSDKMTMSGSKVEGYESEADSIEKVVVGKIIEVSNHPNADKLFVCLVDIGDGDPLTIVTGADNLKPSDIIPVALDGSTLPGGLNISKSEMRGIESNGMLCSFQELGFTDHDFPFADPEGIMVLTGDEATAPLGTDITIALGMDDVVYEFEITPNRPDCLAVEGIGREAAATYGVPFIDHTPIMPQKATGNISDYLTVSIEAPEALRYTAAMVTNVRVKPSPLWLRTRLRMCGVRPINNIVDITNYVMLEYGHPMHAFDYKYVSGNTIKTRMAKAGEKIVTLDGIERNLATDTLVIADAEVPIGIAGVMGGEYSGIYDDTTTIVFEGACFDGPNIRTSAKKLGLRTEASGRFEKGLNPENCMYATLRALELVEELDAGDIIGGIADAYPNPRIERHIPLDVERINKNLGTDITREVMANILLSLGFGIDGDTVIVPRHRYDVTGTHDLSEEVARIYGYNNLPSTVMNGIATARPSERQTFNKALVSALVGYGMYECETFSFYSPKAFDMINLPETSPLRTTVTISNPLGEDTSIMRTTAVPSMLEVVARNYNAQTESVMLFENPTEYIPDKDPEILPYENEKLILAIYGPQYNFYTLKGIVEQLIATANVSGYTVDPDTDGTTYHPGRAATIKLNGKKLATVGEIHPLVLRNYDIRPRVWVADIDVDALFEVRGGVKEFSPLPRHPSIVRDLSLVMNKDMPAATVATAIENAAGELLESLTLFDIYTGEKISQDEISLAYSLQLRTVDKTLTDEEADIVIESVLKELKSIGVVLRS
jgi:phenylalanyl-tRNA synthetase, beta subunit, non-spirochete bacterial